MNVFKSYNDLFDNELTNDLFAQPITKKIYKLNNFKNVLKDD